MQHLAIGKLSANKYGEKKGFLDKYGIPILFFFMVIIVMVGFYLTAGQIREGLIASNNPQVSETNKETAELLNNLGNKMDVLMRNFGRLQEGEPIPAGGTGQGGSGLVPAVNITGE